jgi:hypothetical protein
MWEVVGTQDNEAWTDAKSIRTEDQHKHRPARKEQDLMDLAIEKQTQASRTTSQSATKVSAGLLLLFAQAARAAEEDAALDAEDILTQAEEANALDPVG